MNETELERLVVRLVADVGDYIHRMETVRTTTNQTAEVVKKATEKIETFGLYIRRYSTSIIAAITGLGIKHKVDQTLDAFSEAEAIEMQLTAALEANERAVTSTMTAYKKFANELQAVTTMEDDHILNLLKTAENFGVTGDAAQQAVKQAAALAKVTGSSAEAMVRLSSAMAEGDIEKAMRFGRMVPMLKGIKDQNEFIAKYQTIVATGWKVIGREVETAAGKMTKLKVTVGNIMEEFGKFIADGIKPMIDWLQKGAEWFASLSEKTKKTVASIAGAASALLTLGPAISIVKMVLPIFEPILTIFKMIPVLLGPVGLIITAIGLAIALWVDHMGGIENAWNAIKDAAMAFWAEVEPIFQALWSIGVYAFEMMVQHIKNVWNIGKEAFGKLQAFVDDLLSNMGVNWSDVFTFIRDTIRDTILAAEFIMRNFGEVCNFLWIGIKLGFVRFVNVIEHFFMVALPASFKWFTENWRDIFTDAWNWVKTVFTNIGINIVNAFEALPGPIQKAFKTIKAAAMGIKAFLQEAFESMMANIIDNTLGFVPDKFLSDELKELKAAAAVKAAAGADPVGAFEREFKRIMEEPIEVKDFVWKPLTEGFVRVTKELKIPDRIASELEKELDKEFREAGAALGMKWEEFRDQKLKEFAKVNPDVLKEAKKAGEDIGAAMGAGVGKELKAIDAAIFGGAEATARIRKYRELVEVKPNHMAAPNKVARNPDDQKMINQLDKANELLKKIAERPTFDIGVGVF